MNKTLTYIVVAIAVLVVGFFFLNSYIYNEKQGEPVAYTDALYFLSGEDIKIGGDGLTYFGNEVEGDLDGDGDLDKAFIVTHQPGGSGTFYYLAGAINDNGSYRGTNLMLIGDRIAPQTTEYRDLGAPYGARVIINYADRLPLDPMTTPPSVGKTIYAKYSADNNDFGEVVQDFEGESANGE